MANTVTRYSITDAWVTQPEHLKGAKDEVKLEVGARRNPRLLVICIFYALTSVNVI